MQPKIKLKFTLILFSIVFAVSCSSKQENLLEEYAGNYSIKEFFVGETQLQMDSLSISLSADSTFTSDKLEKIDETIKPLGKWFVNKEKSKLVLNEFTFDIVEFKEDILKIKTVSNEVEFTLSFQKK